MIPAEFLRAVIADPADDLPRLVLADWLAGRDPERAEFIRVQCELAATVSGSPVYRKDCYCTELIGHALQPECGPCQRRWWRVDELRRRERDLLVAHENEWLNDCPPFAAKYPKTSRTVKIPHRPGRIWNIEQRMDRIDVTDWSDGGMHQYAPGQYYTDFEGDLPEFRECRPGDTIRVEFERDNGGWLVTESAMIQSMEFTTPRFGQGNWRVSLIPYRADQLFASPVWTRGFISAVTLSSSQWIQNADKIMAATPLTEVTLTDHPAWNYIDSDMFIAALAHPVRGVALPEHDLSDCPENAVIAQWLCEHQWPGIKFTIPDPPPLLMADDFEFVEYAE